LVLPKKITLTFNFNLKEAIYPLSNLPMEVKSTPSVFWNFRLPKENTQFCLILHTFYKRKYRFGFKSGIESVRRNVKIKKAKLFSKDATFLSVIMNLFVSQADVVHILWRFVQK
jgi:hypothetical protein